VNFNGANLSGAIFSGSELRGATFDGANLKGAKLTHALNADVTGAIMGSKKSKLATQNDAKLVHIRSASGVEALVDVDYLICE
jgi:uncharacterized protein YjbI with pentapeptide repeats